MTRRAILGAVLVWFGAVSAAHTADISSTCPDPPCGRQPVPGDVPRHGGGDTSELRRGGSAWRMQAAGGLYGGAVAVVGAADGTVTARRVHAAVADQFTFCTVCPRLLPGHAASRSLTCHASLCLCAVVPITAAEGSAPSGAGLHLTAVIFHARFNSTLHLHSPHAGRNSALGLVRLVCPRLLVDSHPDLAPGLDTSEAAARVPRFLLHAHPSFPGTQTNRFVMPLLVARCAPVSVRGLKSVCGLTPHALFVGLSQWFRPPPT